MTSSLLSCCVCVFLENNLFWIFASQVVDHFSYDRPNKRDLSIIDG